MQGYHCVWALSLHILRQYSILDPTRPHQMPYLILSVLLLLWVSRCVSIGKTRSMTPSMALGDGRWARPGPRRHGRMCSPPREKQVVATGPVTSPGRWGHDRGQGFSQPPPTVRPNMTAGIGKYVHRRPARPLSFF